MKLIKLIKHIARLKSTAETWVMIKKQNVIYT